MFSKNKKRGFTLVEMLVVIAIIAILVSIMIPVVAGNVDKSKGATNAANLRSIEGKIAAMRVENSQGFKSLVMAAPEGAELLGGLAGLIGWQEMVNVLDQNLAICGPADADGNLSINILPTTAVVTGVPAAKGIEVGNMVVEEGAPMYVFLTETDIIAVYLGKDANGEEVYFNKNNFVEVAETGDFTGEGVGKEDSVEEEIKEEVNKVIDTAKDIIGVSATCSHDPSCSCTQWKDVGSWNWSSMSYSKGDNNCDNCKHPRSEHSANE